MLNRLREMANNLPMLLLALALALAVWISAVTQDDPTQLRIYPGGVAVEVVGQDPSLILTSDIPSRVSVTLKAPSSVWSRLTNENIPVKGVVDLSGLNAGTYDVQAQIQFGISPIQVVACDQCKLTLTLEKLVSKEFEVQLVQSGELAVGYQAGNPVMDQKTVVVSGPESAVNRVTEVRAVLALNKANSSISRAASLEALDSQSALVSDVTITPNKVDVSMAVTQRGGYRNVVVKVSPSGRVASGFRVTNISVFPPTVTVFSADPALVDELPGYVETAALDLTGIKDDLDLQLLLNLPPGVTVVGEQTVNVQVGIAAIEGSVTFTDMKVQVEGLKDGLQAEISPEAVDIIISGPLPTLDTLTINDFRVVVDLSGEDEGSYQRVPTVEFQKPDLNIQSILPGSVEITISKILR